MKKIILLCSVVQLMINHASADKSYKSGAVSGIGLGYSSMSAKTTDNLFFMTGNRENGSFKKTDKNNGFITYLFAGYRFIFKDSFMFGVNLGLTKDTNVLKSIHVILGFPAISKTTMYRHFSVTPELMAGYIFNQKWMAYLKVGINISRFNIDNKIIDGFTVSSNKTTTKIGFKPTIGIEYAVNNIISYFTDVSYEYISAIKESLKNPSNPLILFQDATHNIKIKPHYFTAKIGVLYKF